MINRADFKIRRRINKAVAKKKNPRTETLEEIAYYNILGEYVNNINKLVNIGKKKQDKVSSTLRTLINLLTDLNYLPARSLPVSTE